MYSEETFELGDECYKEDNEVKVIMYWNTVGLSNSKECFDNNKIYHEVCCSHTVYGLTVVLTTLYHVFLIIFREQKVE